MKRIICLISISFALATGANADSNNGSSSRAGLGITKLTIIQRRVVFGGKSFGNVGQYELLTGVAYGELDPKAAGNIGIVNLNNAPVNAGGHVEYSVDIAILKPVDMAKGNGILLYDVVNRGNKAAFVQLNSSRATFSATDVGTGFLMNHGYTVIWSGWQTDLASFEGERPINPDLLRANFPVATNDGKPIIGLSREEFTDVPADPKFTEKLTYPAAATFDRSGASLTVRERETDSRKPLPLSSWRYEDANRIEITAEPGFDRGAIYEFIYPATNPVVNGIGFAATRDFVSFLRYSDQDSGGQPNPLSQKGASVKATLGIGISQSGRYIKDFLYQGFNADVAGRPVFDGIMPIISGSRRTFTNYQFAQPGRFSREHEDHLYPGDQFPFSYGANTDAITGKTDSLLMNCGKSHTCPRIIHVDSDTEVWQGRSSLVTTDTTGHFLAIPENVRAYMLSGLPHVAAPGPGVRGECEQYQNPLQYSPYLRALLVAMSRWVTDGVAPPPSTYPNLKDHTLLPIDKAKSQYPSIPGAPFSAVINQLHVTDPDSMPPSLGPNYALLIPLFDSDGNPKGGIEPVDVAVPTATYAGRNFRAESFAKGELCGLSGEYIPFAATRQERVASGDSRPSLEERYMSQQDYSEKRRRAVNALVQQRFLLPEDAMAMSSGTLPSAAPVQH
jgi:Alpha/beta hydrolase domain